MIREAIAKVVGRKNLTQEEAKQVFDEIMEGNATEAQIASLITELRIKGETADEIIGAADVLEVLGVKVDTTPKRNSEILSKTGLAFLFAPAHHPAMKYAAKPRKEIGIRTIFNILGPITNPAGASTYLLGAYDEPLAKTMASALAGLNVKRALVVTGNGYDEATLTGKTVVFEVENGKIERKEYTPEKFGFETCSETDLAANEPKESANIILQI